MSNVFVLMVTIGGADNLMGLFDHPEKAEERIVLNVNREADFQPRPLTTGLGHWEWKAPNDMTYHIFEMPVL